MLEFCWRPWISKTRHTTTLKVLYDTGEFLEKNRDPLRFEIIQLFSWCNSQLPQLFASMINPSQKTTSSSKQLGTPVSQKQSVITKFKNQLFKLMQQLESTTPHFIRCIKPNSKKVPGAFENDLVSEQLRCCGILEVVRISRSGYPTRMTHQEFTRRYGILFPNNNTCQDALSTAIAILQQFDILPEMYQVGYMKLYFRAGQIGSLEDVRKQVLKASLEVQKHYRGYLARRNFRKLGGGTTTLQSYIRGEIVRREYIAFLRLKRQVAWQELQEQLIAVLQIQSVIRGWMVRRHFINIQDLKQSSVSIEPPERMSSEMKEEQTEMQPSVTELQKNLLKAEVTLGRKEKENAVLREQVQQYEAKWLEYESRLKSMEELWHNQMTSIQMSLVATRKSISAEKTICQPCDGESPRFFECKESSSVTKGDTATCGSSSSGPELAIAEYEQKKHKSDDEAQTRAIVKLKSLNVARWVSGGDELVSVKHKLSAWKTDIKGRLKDAKSKVPKPGGYDADKIRRKWNDLVTQRSRH